MRLSSGFTGEDKVWRQIVTILDAEAGGCNLFDLDQLRDYEYSLDQFDNLLMCNFIDETKSIFPQAAGGGFLEVAFNGAPKFLCLLDDEWMTASYIHTNGRG